MLSLLPRYWFEVIPICLCCGYSDHNSRIILPSAPLVIPSVFDVQSDVFFDMGFMPGKKTTSRVFRGVYNLIAYIVYPPFKIHHTLSKSKKVTSRVLSILLCHVRRETSTIQMKSWGKRQQPDDMLAVLSEFVYSSRHFSPASIASWQIWPSREV